MSKKTGRFFSNVKAQGKEEQPGVNPKVKKHKNLQSPMKSI